ncbi:thiamine phosphate synthase [Clostridium tarantellae]|uniref:Thiamine-phosphate synthase n=1 Tax=Clostridium tarantellae TaxID=39493 RepID=A0A6I1MI50_9CLOT|nr:thiamine phosphate synthase [Clostridium tarantellae]MPQ43045.1 thiamine phosphate synthase [Clostridium tarantellae]
MNVKGKKLYLVTDYNMEFNKLLSKVEEALKGGVSIVQYRAKNKTTRKMCKEALLLKELSHKYKALFIVNDRLDVALVVDADGIHVGQDDMEVYKIKEILPKDKIIGVSVHDLEETRIAIEQGADYIGVGALYNTNTKNNAKIVSLEMLKKIRKKSSIPIYGIGGLTVNNLTKTLRETLDGIAIVSEILLAKNATDKAKDLLNCMKN